MVHFEANTFLHNLVHNGLTLYKTKQSNSALTKQLQKLKNEPTDRKGVLFAVHRKENFQKNGVKGYIITSKETLVNHAAQLSHFTPNLYRYGRYTNASKTHIKGFTEDQLQQINTFVIDIDTKQHDVQTILLACMDESIGTPSCIVETPNGYQIYFVLETPIYISNKHNFRSLRVAKRIAFNLKRSLQTIDADLFCNDFGFFRMPKKENVVWYDTTARFSVKQCIDFSMRCDEEETHPLFTVMNQPMKEIQMDWVHALIQTTTIHGKKGQIGRNNLLFTFALLHYEQGISETQTFDFLDEVNTNLQCPLTTGELVAILRSAYSGRYRGASKAYIEQLLAIYAPNTEVVHVKKNYWYKFKKERTQRQRSHYDEWEADIIAYVEQQTTNQPAFICTQKQLCQALNIAQSSLNVVLKRSKNLSIKTVGKGRYAKTRISTKQMIESYCIYLIQTRKKRAFTVQILENVLNQSVGTVFVTTRISKWIQELFVQDEKYRGNTS